ncbi:MAG: amino acid permease [Nitrospirae bacterium]|nr:MAG: amino acid permease [Nitrospirota bacterium]
MSDGTIAVAGSAERAGAGALVRSLGLLDATMIVIGSMVGSGIFIVSADIARQVHSPGLLLIVWLVTGAMTVIGALCYGELAAAMPAAGGQYVYLREAFGPLWGFLYGWTMLLIIQTATIAAVAIAFARFTGVLIPWFSSATWLWQIGTFGPYRLWFGELGPYTVGLNTQNLLAILSIIVLTWVNLRGIRTGALVQNVLTLTKTGALLGVIVLGVVFATDRALTANFGHFWEPAQPSTGRADWVGLLTMIGVAMVGSLFAADAWNNVTFVAGEVRDPERNLPRSLALGTGLVIAIYLLANLAYLCVLPLRGAPDGATALERGIQFAAEDRVATAVAEVVLGHSGGVLMAIAVMISTFGCNNGLILAGARIYYAMAKDRMFFASVGALNRHLAPSLALLMQGAWASVLCLSGTYGQLLDFLIFSVLLFYILTIGGVFVLRRTRPEMARPYRTWGYPVLPALYIVMALFIEIQLLRYKPQYTWPGLLLVLLGIPVYWVWKKATKR